MSKSHKISYLDKPNIPSPTNNYKSLQLNKNFQKLNDQEQQDLYIEQSLKSINDFMKKFNDMMLLKKLEDSHKNNKYIQNQLKAKNLNIGNQFQYKNNSSSSLNNLKNNLQKAMKINNCYQNSQISYEKLITEVDQDQDIIQDNYIQYDDYYNKQQKIQLSSQSSYFNNNNLTQQSLDEISINIHSINVNQNPHLKHMIKYKNKLSTVMQQSVSQLMTTPRQNLSCLSNNQSHKNINKINSQKSSSSLNYHFSVNTNTNQDKIVCVQNIQIPQQLLKEKNQKETKPIQIKLNNIGKNHLNYNSCKNKKQRSNSFKKILSYKNSCTQKFHQSINGQKQVQQRNQLIMSPKIIDNKRRKSKIQINKTIHHIQPNKQQQEINKQIYGCFNITAYRQNNNNQKLIKNSQNQNFQSVNSVSHKFQNNSDSLYFDFLQNNEQNSHNKNQYSSFKQKNKKKIFLKQCVCRKKTNTLISNQIESLNFNQTHIQKNLQQYNSSLNTLRNKSQEGRKRKGISLTRTKNSLANISLIYKNHRQNNMQKRFLNRPISNQERKKRELQKSCQKKSDLMKVSLDDDISQKASPIKLKHKQNSLTGLRTIASMELKNQQNKINNNIEKQIEVKKENIYNRLRVNMKKVTQKKQRLQQKQQQISKKKHINKQNTKKVAPRQVKINIDCQNLKASFKNNKIFA